MEETVGNQPEGDTWLVPEHLFFALFLTVSCSLSALGKEDRVSQTDTSSSSGPLGWKVS